MLVPLRLLLKVSGGRDRSAAVSAVPQVMSRRAVIPIYVVEARKEMDSRCRDGRPAGEPPQTGCDAEYAVPVHQEPQIARIPLASPRTLNSSSKPEGGPKKRAM